MNQPDVLRKHLESAVDRCCPPSIRSERDDIVQDVWLKAEAMREQGKTVNNAWLKRVAYTTMVDALRKRGPVAQPVSEPISSAPTPEQHTHHRRLAAGLRRCMAHLAEARRRAVLLFVNGHTASEVARLLATTPKSAENLIYRGRSELRTCLAKQGITTAVGP